MKSLVLKRVFAGIIDYTLCFSMAFIYVLLKKIFKFEGDKIGEYIFLIGICMMDVFPIYPGKKLFSLKLLNVDGNIPNRFTLVFRNLIGLPTLILDLIFLPISIALNQKQNRIVDVLFGVNIIDNQSQKSFPENSMLVRVLFLWIFILFIGSVFAVLEKQMIEAFLILGLAGIMTFLLKRAK